MAKYTEDFKYMVVQEYLQGPLGYQALALKYGVKSKSQLQNWVARYRKYGVEGLSAKRTRDTYSAQFKLEVLGYMKQTGASTTETAFLFGVRSPALISSWNTAFLRGGVGALERPKGRPKDK